jgi:hypothetical protein
VGEYWFKLVALPSAKGADARRQTMEELAGPLGGALDSVPVLRDPLKTPKEAT